MIFFWPHVSHLCNIGFKTVKKNWFFEKKLEIFEIVKCSELDFALEKSTENDFFDLMYLTWEV